VRDANLVGRQFDCRADQRRTRGVGIVGHASEHHRSADADGYTMTNVSKMMPIDSDCARPPISSKRLWIVYKWVVDNYSA
jgi:hypothetical protein